MKRRFVLAVTLSLACVGSVDAVSSARALSLASPVHAMFSKTKTVKFSLRNDTGAPVKLKAGADSMTLEKGKVLELKLAEGTQVTLEEATATQPAGTVVALVSSTLSGNTLVIH